MSLDRGSRRPVVSDLWMLMRGPALVIRVVDVGRDVKDVAQLQRAASVRHARWDLHACRVLVTHQELHQLTAGRRPFARVVQRNLERSYRVPPVGLMLVDV